MPHYAYELFDALAKKMECEDDTDIINNLRDQYPKDEDEISDRVWNRFQNWIR